MALLSLYFPFFAQEQQFYFHQIGVEDGLPQGQVLAIAQDSSGYIWLGTMKGLVRYDGNEFRLFGAHPDDSTSLSFPTVENLLADSKGNLWAGTQKGLNLFDPKRERFRQFLKKEGEAYSLPGNHIITLTEDPLGRVWVGTYGGLAYFDHNTGRFHTLELPGYSDASRKAGGFKGFVGVFGQGPEGSLWAYGSEKWWLVPLSLENIQSFDSRGKYGVKNPYSWFRPLYIGDDSVVWLADEQHITKWQDGHISKRPLPPEAEGINIMEAVSAHRGIWMATASDGVWHLNLDSGRFRQFPHVIGSSFGLNSNNAQAVFLDREENLWVGTFNGVCWFNPYRNPFLFFQHRPGHRLPINQLLRVHAGHGGEVWTSGYDGRLWLAPEPGRQAREIPYAPRPGSKARIGTFHTSSDGTTWMGCTEVQGANGQGLWAWSPREARIRQLKLDDTLRQASIYYIEEDKHSPENLWLGTNFGLCRFNRESGQIRWRLPRSNLPALETNRIFAAIQDDHGNIWMHLEDYFAGKLGYFNKEEERFYLLDISAFMPGQKAEILIRGFTRQTDSNIWLATGQGLGMIDPLKKKFRLFRTSDSLAENELMGVACDADGNIWIKSLKYISRFIPGSGRFQHYPVGPDMQEFNTVGASVGPDGRIFFNGNNGFYAFHPSLVKPDTISPKVVLTEIHIPNRPAPLETAPAYLNQLSLYHKDKIVSFEFAGLHFRNPRQNSYSYQLEGFDESWVDAGTVPKAFYTNLRPGRYTFRARAANPDGVWGESASLAIVVHSPWWANGFAYSIYGAALAALAIAFYRFQLNRNLALAEARRLKELDAFKSRFYANLSHEFRTPLTLIEGLAERALRKSEPLSDKDLKGIVDNSRKLLSLINQMLSLSKLEAGVLKPEYEAGNLIAFLQYLTDSFQPLAEGKNISLRFQSECPKLEAAFDREKLQVIVGNLLSNALKFTPEKGRVIVDCNLIPKQEAGGAAAAEMIRIRVKDTGPGISEDQLPRIFGRFYSLSQASSFSGVGIGLALAKELAELMGGKIEVASEWGKGSAFTVCLPFRKPEEGHGQGQKKMELPALFGRLPTQRSTGRKAARRQPAAHTDRPLVLIIEDSADVAGFIADSIRPDYRVEIAGNGSQGLEQAFQLIPDLAICDVMMPEKDGFEVCRILKEDLRTSHIPIILLTARADESSKLHGLSQGADAYLAKPFSERELMIRIEQLLEQRQRLQAHYQQSLSRPASKPAETNPPMGPFLLEAQKQVEAHLSEVSFNVAALCRAVGMSQPQLHRKLTALAGMAPVRFIYFIRLNKARELLLQQPELTIAEVAYDTGFSSPSYFSRLFLREFGCTPTDYREKGALKTNE